MTISPLPTDVIAFAIQSIPDIGDHQLAAGCGGDVRARALSATESLLRALAILPKGAVTCAIRFAYDPTRAFQDRTQVSLELRGAPGTPWLSLAKRIVSPGALQHVYETLREFDEQDYTRLADVRTALAACTDITRLEHAVESDEDVRKNRKDGEIPTRYWVPRPFAPRAENDWSMLDRVLADLTTPALIEIMVAPADIAHEREIQFGYTKVLMGVNSYSDDLTVSDLQLDAALAQDDSRKVRDPMADEFLSEHQDLRRTLIEPHLQFVFRAWGGSPEDARLLAAVSAECALGGGKYRLIDVDPKSDRFQRVKDASTGTDATVAPGWPEFWDDPDLSEGMRQFSRVPHLATVEELSSIFRLPVGLPGIAPRTMARARTEPPRVQRNARGEIRPTILIGDDLEMGAPQSRAIEREALQSIFEGGSADVPEIRLPLELLKKHLFIAGVPGSGKTTAMNNIVTQLAFRGIPFLVIEPAKTEYRLFTQLREHPHPKVAELARTLRVYSVGNERISPLRYNPLAYPKGISRDEHMGAVLHAFRASMPLEGPMLGLLTNAVEAAYENKRAGVRFPRLRDVYEQGKRIVKDQGYSGEVNDNLTAAIELRLGGLVRGDLGRVFDCDEGIPDATTLFTQPVVLEMDYLTQEHACLMTLMILSSLREHIRINRESGSTLKHVTFIEEAHNIVGRVPQGASGESDPKGFAADFVARMLAEVRALGEGIVVADQLPSAVSPEVIKNTGAKLAHRLVANDDREELGGTMLLDDVGVQELARLAPGEAYFYAEGFYRPRRVRAVPSHLLLGVNPVEDRAGVFEIPNPVKREELRDVVEGDAWYLDDASDRSMAIEKESRQLVSGLERIELEVRTAITTAERRVIDWFADTADAGERELAERSAKSLRDLADGLAAESARVRSVVRKLHALDAIEHVGGKDASAIGARIREARRTTASALGICDAVWEYAAGLGRLTQISTDQEEE